MHMLNLSTVIDALDLQDRQQDRFADARRDRLTDLVYDAMDADVVDGGDLWLYLEELATCEELTWLNQTDWFPRERMAEMLFLTYPGATRVYMTD